MPTAKYFDEFLCQLIDINPRVRFFSKLRNDFSDFYCGILRYFIHLHPSCLLKVVTKVSRFFILVSNEYNFESIDQLINLTNFGRKMLIFETKLGFWTISTRVIHLGMSDFFLEPVVRYRIENGRILFVEWTGGKMNGADGDFVESELRTEFRSESKVELEFVLF